VVVKKDNKVTLVVWRENWNGSAEIGVNKVKEFGCTRRVGQRVGTTRMFAHYTGFTFR
jgi:hypothetical protein